MFSDADGAELYDLLNRFYHELVMAADSVLNADCGTGAQYGDWDSTPITTASQEIITIARK